MRRRSLAHVPAAAGLPARSAVAPGPAAAPSATRAPWRRAAALGAVVALVAALAGCGTPDAPTPDGFVRVVEDGTSVAVPSTWVEGTPTGFYTIARQDAAGDGFAVRLLAGTRNEARTARGALNDIRDFAGIIPDTPTNMSEVERDDGREMWVWDVVYGDGAYNLVAWGLHDDELDQTVVVTLSATGTVDPELATKVRDSIDIVEVPAKG